MSTNPHQLSKLSVEEYYDLHPNFIVPINLKIDVVRYKKDIQSYNNNFRVWGDSHLDWPRFGIPLANLTGNLDDQEDPSCWPLDKWWKKHPDQFYWDHDFCKLTEVTKIKSLLPLSILHPFMIRSNILKWNKGGQFVPHVDMVPELITHIRLWGTTETSETYELKFGNTTITEFEPGRLYLMDTIALHSAKALCNDAHTFFITITLDGLNTVRQLRREYLIKHQSTYQGH